MVQTTKPPPTPTPTITCQPNYNTAPIFTEFRVLNFYTNQTWENWYADFASDYCTCTCTAKYSGDIPFKAKQQLDLFITYTSQQYWDKLSEYLCFCNE